MLRGYTLSFPFLLLGYVSARTVMRFMVAEPTSIEQSIAPIAILMLVWSNWPELQKFWREGHPTR